MILPTRVSYGAMTELRLPNPVPLGPRMYAIVSAAALGAVTGAPLVKAVLHMGHEREMMGITVSTTLLSAVLVAFITHQKGERVPLLAALLALPLGALNTGLSLAISELMAGNVQQAGPSLVMGTLFGVVFGAPSVSSSALHWAPDMDSPSSCLAAWSSTFVTFPGQARASKRVCPSRSCCSLRAWS